MSIVRAALVPAQDRLEKDRARRDAKARAVIEASRAMCRPALEDALHDEQGERTTVP